MEKHKWELKLIGKATLVISGCYNKDHRLDGLSRHSFLTVQEVGKSKIKGAGQNQFQIRALFLACKWLPSCLVFTW